MLLTLGWFIARQLNLWLSKSITHKQQCEILLFGISSMEFITMTFNLFYNQLGKKYSLVKGSGLNTPNYYIYCNRIIITLYENKIIQSFSG